MKSENKLATAILCVALGLMFILMKGEVISVALTIIGAVAIVMAIVDFSAGAIAPGILKAVAGVCVIVFGWMFVNLALYILSAVLIVQGLFQLIFTVKNLAPVLSGAQKCFAFCRPIASLTAGCCLLFNQGGTINWVFVVAGILLLAEGILSLADGKR